MAHLHRPERHGDGRLGGIDDGNGERVFQGLAMPRHAGASHDHGFGAVLLLQLAPDLDHAPERALSARGFGHGHFQRALSGEAINKRHLRR